MQHRRDPATLVAAVRSRGPSASEAEAELCSMFAGRVRTYATRHVADVASRDDFVQRVLLTMLVSLREGRLRDDERLDRFVLGICRNTRYAAGRDGSKHRDIRQQVMLQTERWVELPVDRADLPKLSICLSTLSARSREVVFMAYRDGLNASEIAARLELNAGNVRMIRHRALTSLRECLHAPGGA